MLAKFPAQKFNNFIFTNNLSTPANNSPAGSTRRMPINVVRSGDCSKMARLVGGAAPWFGCRADFLPGQIAYAGEQIAQRYDVAVHSGLNPQFYLALALALAGAGAGAGTPDLTRGSVFNQASNAMDAAVGGQGVAIGRSALAAADLLAGRLIRPFGPSLPVNYAYYIVCPKTTARRPKISAFRDWLIQEAQADVDGMKALGIYASTE